MAYPAVHALPALSLDPAVYPWSDALPGLRPACAVPASLAQQAGAPSADALLLAAFDSPLVQAALLDEAGRILRVNAAWRIFGREHGQRDRQFGVGRNYLHVCDQAVGEGAHEARQVALGIRQVLGGMRSYFHLAYPLHAPGGVRWWNVHVTRLDEPVQRRAIVVHEPL